MGRRKKKGKEKNLAMREKLVCAGKKFSFLARPREGQKRKKTAKHAIYPKRTRFQRGTCPFLKKSSLWSKKKGDRGTKWRQGPTDKNLPDMQADSSQGTVQMGGGKKKKKV